MYSKFSQLGSRYKYHNKKQTYEGYSYDSKKEANTARDLDSKLKAGLIGGWERQVREDLYGLRGSKIAEYYCDFVVYHNGCIFPDGYKEFLEVKSAITKTPVWSIKWKLLKDKYKGDGSIVFTVK